MMRRDFQHLSSFPQAEEQTEAESSYPLTFGIPVQEDIETLNKQSSLILLHQLDQAVALISKVKGI